ncbi:MAG: Asp-tRNA(Asn)/Glu-tRNA(Gln) amidotransferase subunit GatB [Clostridia bacterium]|nr:Asp-tRNA(Asn)/Glu-tRNA(Gln) amidotransferase subunit GatB [Clostridia bacterium]
MSKQDYEVVIGLEVHAELSTKTKIFCSCSTEFGGEPNSHCCPVCTAMPGAVPVLNEKVVEYAVKAGLATNCKISNLCWQDRKNYFYPDMPHAYQVSQAREHICQEGYVEIETEEGSKKIRLIEIHIEQDAGKLNHGQYGEGSLVDLNRAGVPLIEIVSYPDMRSAEEVESYLRTLKSILEYIEVSDCKMQEGSLRADINISVRKKGDTEFGPKVEMKNMNSFKFIVNAINYESNRQIELMEKGEEVLSETVRWDTTEEITLPMRDKDSAAYRCFPEPELLPIVLTEEYINSIRDNLPELPEARKTRYMAEYGLNEYDAKQITSSKYMAEFFEKAEAKCKNAKIVANWLMGDISRKLKEAELEINEVKFTAENLGEMIELIDKGTISSAIAKKVFETMFETGKEPKTIVEEQGLVQITDESAIKEIVIKVIENNPKSVEDYKAGKDKAVGFIVGQVMKESRGKANPGTVNKLILEELNK